MDGLKSRLRKALKGLNISAETPMVAVSLMKDKEQAAEAIYEALHRNLFMPTRISSGTFVMCVDHCFPLKGKGTVMTGTIIDGSCRLVN